MLALALAATATLGGDGDVVVMGPPSGLMMMHNDLGAELSSMLSQLSRMQAMAQAPRPRPTNPCDEDARKLHCRDGACLRRAADSLSPACAAFLLGSPEPSPAPAEEVREARPQPRMQSSGFFSITSTDGNGDVHRASGPLSMGSVMSMLPPGFMNMMGGGPGMMPGRGIMVPMRGNVMVVDEEEEDEEEMMVPQVPSHPCGREIGACVRETGHRDREAIEVSSRHHSASARHPFPLPWHSPLPFPPPPPPQECLVAHLPHLSPTCRCFVQQTATRSSPTPSRPTPAIAHAMELRSRPAEAVAVVRISEEPEEPEAHPLHRLSCLFFVTALFLLSLMITRALLTALCGTSSKRARNVVMVPPSPALTKKTPPSSAAKAGRVAIKGQLAEPILTTRI